MWDLAKGEELRTLDDAVTALAVSPDGRTCISALDKTLKVWDLATGKKLRALRGHSETVTALAVSPILATIIMYNRLYL